MATQSFSGEQGYVPGTCVPLSEVEAHLDQKTIQAIVEEAIGRIIFRSTPFGESPSTVLLKAHGQAVVAQAYGDQATMDGAYELPGF
jgi:hypothetical protein